MSKIDLEYIASEQSKMKEYTDRFSGKKTTSSAKPIYDGIINPEKYVKSKYRICWILKEPYDNDAGDNKGGGWSLSERINEKIFSGKGSPTFEPMIYASYSLLNDFIPYSKMDDMGDNLNMVNFLKETALINVGKMPAKTRSIDSDISKKYEFWKPLLFWQLTVYNPQILIFGNTFQHFKNDLHIKDSEVIERNSYPIHYTVKNNKIYLHAYHPAQTSTEKEAYIEGIRSVVKDNINKLMGNTA